MKYQMINEQLILNNHQRTWLEAQLQRLHQIDHSLLYLLKKRYEICTSHKHFAALNDRKKQQVYQLRRIFTKRNQRTHTNTKAFISSVKSKRMGLYRNTSSQMLCMYVR